MIGYIRAEMQSQDYNSDVWDDVVVLAWRMMRSVVWRVKLPSPGKPAAMGDPKSAWRANKSLVDSHMTFQLMRNTWEMQAS